MTHYITSDLHFGHANILKFNPATRQFADVEHMNYQMVQMWNEIVKPEDTVYILGDVAFMKKEDATKIVKSLNGRKILIKGNHDGRLLTDSKFRACFSEIHAYHETTFNGVKLCMFHYPIMEWNNCHRGSVQLHGHLHGKPSGLEQYRVKDVSFDATGNIVSKLDDIVAQALLRDIKTHGDGSY